MGEAGLRLALAHLLVAGGAGRAAPQAQTNGTVTRSPGSQPLRRRRPLRPRRPARGRDVRQARCRGRAPPAMPVAAAQARRLDPDDRAVWGGGRVGQLAHVELSTEDVKGNRSHLMSLR